MRVQVVDESIRERARRIIAETEQRVEEHVLRALIVARAFGRIDEWEYAHEQRESGLVALYDVNTPHGRAIMRATREYDDE